MFQYISKNKSLIIVLVVVLASFVWMTSQIREPGGPTLLERGVAGLAYPFVVSVDFAAGTARGVWEGYIYLVGLVPENDRLSEENGRLFRENTGLREKLERRSRVEELWTLKEDTGYPAMPARVVGRDSTSWFKSVWVDAGTDDGVAKNMPAVVAYGLVGRVIKPYSGSARVMLITNPGSSVSCMLERSRENGILTGDGSGTCTLSYVDKKSDVAEGDLVITSGLDMVYPKAMPVGVVTTVDRDAPGYFQVVRVKPTADLDHIEDLLIMKYSPPAKEQ